MPAPVIAPRSALELHFILELPDHLIGNTITPQDATTPRPDVLSAITGPPTAATIPATCIEAPYTGSKKPCGIVDMDVAPLMVFSDVRLGAHSASFNTMPGYVRLEDWTAAHLGAWEFEPESKKRNIV